MGKDKGGGHCDMVKNTINSLETNNSKNPKPGPKYAKPSKVGGGGKGGFGGGRKRFA
jgi:hypothetical protein